MANLRTFYACQAVAVAPLIPDVNNNYSNSVADSDYQFIHGVQSVGINTNFDFENLFELGQLEIYDAVLNIPSVEITLEKVLDGYKTVYGHIGSGQALAKASKHRANVRFALYSDETNASGTPIGLVTCTGMYINNVTYTFPVDGNCTESVTLVGNHKSWSYGGGEITIPDSIKYGSALPDDQPNFTGNRVIRRQDVVYSGPGSTKAQNVTLTLNLGREDIFEFGQRIPYAKVATYPIEVTSEIQSIAISGSYDDVSFTEATNDLPDVDKTITVTIPGFFRVDMGSKNFLTSIAHGGGDATGGNATVTRNYTTYNTFLVTDSGAI